MFAAPPVIETSVFLKMPESLGRDGANQWTTSQSGGVPTPTFLEGPSFDRDGNLWVTDIPWGRLFKITPKGDISVGLEYDGEPNGLKFHQDGRAFIADHKNGLMVFDPKTGRIDCLVDRVDGERFKGVNDLVFASNGDLYFTDQGQTGLHDPSGRLFRLRQAGAKKPGPLELVLDGIPSPNGLVLNKAEDTVFLAVTRNNAVWRVPMRPSGSNVYKVGIFIQLSGGVGPDGMAMCDDDSLVVCHTRLGSVWIFAPNGEPLYRIKSCAGAATTNCAFGGADRKTLFITESQSGSVLQAKLPIAGRAMFSHS